MDGNLRPYTIDRFDGGISDRPNRGVSGSFRFGHGINLRDNLSVLTCNQKLKKESGSVVTELIHFFVVATDGNTYGFGNAGGIYKRTSGGTWSLLQTDADGAIRGAAEFEHNNGSGTYVKYLCYATQTKLKKVPLSSPGSAPTTVGTFAQGISGDWHTMILALGVLLVCDGDRLAMLDYEGAFNATALRLPPDLKAQALIEQGEDAIIGAIERARSQRGWAFGWRKDLPSWAYRRNIQGKGVTALAFFESGMLAITGSSTIKYWDLVNLIPLKRLPGGGGVNPGALDEYKDVPHFGVWGGSKNGIYSYGRTDKNGAFSLNLEYLISPVVGAGTLAQIETKMADANVEIGAVAAPGDTLLVSWKDGSTYGVDVIDTANKAPAVYEGLQFDANHPESQKLWRSIKAVAAEPLPDGTSVKLKYRTNQDDTWVETQIESGVETMDDDDRTALFPIEAEGEIYEIRAELTPNANAAPKLQSISTYFEDESDY